MHPAVLLKSFIRSSSFSVESLGFSMHRIMLFASSDTFTSCFPLQIPFISIYFLIVVARTSNIMLNRSGQSGDSWLVTDFSGKAFSFSLSSVILAVGLSEMAFLMLRCVLIMPCLVRLFNHEWMRNFVKCIFCIYWDGHVVFDLVNVLYYIDWFANFELSCELGMHLTWSLCVALLICCWAQLAMLRVFVSYSSKILACSFLFWFSPGFGIRWLQSVSGCVPTSSEFWESLRRISLSSLFGRICLSSWSFICREVFWVLFF